MGFNPIVRFELIRAARWRRHYVMRVALGLVPLYVIWVLYAFGTQAGTMSGGQARLISLQHLPRLASLVFLELTWAQGVAVLLLVPGLVAGSIAEEDRRGTMLDLLATPLSSGAIVLGKLAARSVHVGVAVGVSLPVVVPLLLLGALDPVIVAHAYATLLALTLFVGSLSLLVAVIIRNPRRAIPAAYLLVGGWLLLPDWWAPIAGRLGWPFSWLRVLIDGVLQSHPNAAVLYVWRISLARVSYPASLAGVWWGFLKTVPRVVGFQAACSALFLLLAAVYLRPLRLGLRGHRGRELAVPSRPAIGDDPMLWKERYVPARRSRAAVGLAAILLGVLLFGPLIEPAWAAFREWQASWWGGLGLGARARLNESLRQLSAGLYLCGLVAVAVLAASSVTGEHERGTWTSLATTLVTGRELVGAKVSGTLRAARGLSIPFLLLWTIGLATGSVHPLGALAAATGLTIYARYAAALGVLFSMLSRTSDRAITATLLTLMLSNAIALLFIPSNLIGPLASSWHAVYLAGVTPLVEWVSLASPMEIRCWLQGQPWETRIALPWGLWGTWIRLDPGLVRTYLASLALHAIGTIAVMRVAARLFDSERDGHQRPLRSVWGRRSAVAFSPAGGRGGTRPSGRAR